MPNQNFFVQPWFLTNGTSPLNADWTASNMLDPKVVGEPAVPHDLIHVDGVSPIPGKDVMDNQFFAGQVAMINRGHWIVQGAKRAEPQHGRRRSCPPKESDTTVIGFGGYAVSKSAKDPELAQALVRRSPASRPRRKRARAAAACPGRKSAAETPAFLEFPPSAFLYYQTLPHTKPVPSPANFQEVEKIFIRYYTAMMSDEVSIADGVKQADAELNASFERLKKQSGN